MMQAADRAQMVETAARLLRTEYSFAQRAGRLALHAGHDPALWQRFAELGWLDLPIPGAAGGLDGGAADLLALMAEFGRALVVEPYLSAVVLAAAVLARHGTPAQRARAAGGLVACGFAEPGNGFDRAARCSVAMRAAGGFRLNGEKCVVLGGDTADLLIVNARLDGAESLFLVPACAAGVRRRGYALIDARRAADIVFENVALDAEAVLGAAGAAAEIVGTALRWADIAILGEALGAMQAAIAATIAHLKTRTQFGRTLENFQVLRHRVVDMFIASQESEALAQRAASALDAGSADAGYLITCARAYVAEAGRKVGEGAVQLHGAIAITDECIVGHYLKRLVVTGRLFGDAAHQLDQLAG